MTNDDEITMDTLFDQEIDSGAAEEILKRALPPKGNYHTDSEYPLTVFVNKFEDKNGGTRRMLTLVGRVVATINGEECVANLRMRLSPDARKSAAYEDGQPTGELSDKDDAASRRWAEAVKVYKGVYGEYPRKESELIDALKEMPFRVFLYHTQDGEVGFSNIAPMRGR